MILRERVGSKLTSGRYLLTVFFGGTYCIVILWCLWLVSKEAMELSTFLGIFASFTTLSGMIVESYFKKQRKEEKK